VHPVAEAAIPMADEHSGFFQGNLRAGEILSSTKTGHYHMGKNVNTRPLKWLSAKSSV